MLSAEPGTLVLELESGTLNFELEIMQKLFIVLYFVTAVITGLRAQYVNTDSLVHLPGFEFPHLLSELGSLFYSPESEYYSGEIYISEQNGSFFEQFSLPSAGKVISRFGPRSGRMHSGTDIKMEKGDTVFAVFHGMVSRARSYYGYGNMVVLDHGGTLETSYAHLSSFLVKPGEHVRKGQPIGLAGNTGRATTNHLHFEIRDGNKPVDPELVFDFENGKIRDEVNGVNSLASLNQELKTSGYSVNESVPENYTVRNGDSLWKISRRFKTSLKTLYLLNSLDENSVLQVGMVLKLF
jgi:murein DD-endopeptidase MepM/ murein hydrolase activator NlpD